MPDHKTKIGKCGYHLCRKKAQLYRCKYCGDYFCKEHSTAGLALSPKFKWEINQLDPSERKLVEEAWESKDTHPCLPYTGIFWENMEKQKQKEAEEMKKVMDRMKTVSIKPWPVLKDKEAREHYREAQNQVFGEDISNWFKRNVLKLILLLFISLIMYSLLDDANHNRPLGTQLEYIITRLPSNVSNAPNILTQSTNICQDGTPDLECSFNEPYRCINGTLIKDATKCGCPFHYIQNGTDCKIKPTCSSGTFYGECSGQQRPLFCNDGKLIQNASYCGCPTDQVASGDSCISKYAVNSQNRTDNYVLRGQNGSITILVYGGLNTYFASLSRFVTCSSSGCPSGSELIGIIALRQVDNPLQTQYLTSLVDAIKNKTSDEDDQVRIAVSFVQNIPYDDVGLQTKSLNSRYPYEVVYDNTGVCAEKSRLLAFILKELGYGVVLFEYIPESHEAVGIKCPMQYSYLNTSYCFIETTTPSIITDSNGDYVRVGKLSSSPQMIQISEGKSFDSVSVEYYDALTYNSISAMGQFISPSDYQSWYSLVNKYGIPVCDGIICNGQCYTGCPSGRSTCTSSGLRCS